MMKKILIADDEPDVLDLVRTLFSKTGYEVIEAKNGAQAWDLVRQHRPDLVLVDYRMPLLNGIQVCQKIKADEDLKHTPVIFITASPGIITPDMVTACGANDYVVKPFDIMELFEKVKRLIE